MLLKRNLQKVWCKSENPPCQTGFFTSGTLLHCDARDSMSVAWLHVDVRQRIIIVASVILMRALFSSSPQSILRHKSGSPTFTTPLPHVLPLTRPRSVPCVSARAARSLRPHTQTLDAHQTQNLMSIS